MKYLKLSAYLIAIIFITIACVKEEKEKDFDPNTLKDNAIAENIFSDVFQQSGKASRDADDETSQKTDIEILSNCPSLTITPFDTTWPKTLVLDYGSTNCTGTDLRQRRGKVNIVATERWREAGSITTITFDNYFIDNHKVEGTKIITNLGRNQNNNLVYDVKVQNAVVTKPDNTTIQWGSVRSHEWIEGESTILNPFDDVYLISGNVTGTSAAGVNYTIDTQQPLNVKFGCRWVREGVIEINIQNLQTITLDYGDGTCNPNATATYLGVSYPILLQ